jgi:Magnesium chelatase, subunit ChlI C-terminal
VHLPTNCARRRESARGYHRVLRVARTLADLDGEDGVRRSHFAEALAYRALADELRQGHDWAAKPIRLERRAARHVASGPVIRRENLARIGGGHRPVLWNWCRVALSAAIGFGFKINRKRFHHPVMHDVGTDQDRQFDDLAVVKMASQLGEDIVGYQGR